MENELLGIALYDIIKGQYVAFTFCNSKPEYIRSTVEQAILQYKNLNDLQPTVLCRYNVVSGEITPEHEEFGFDVYQMPATKADALAPLGVNFAKEALEFERYKEEKRKKLEESNKE